MGSRNSKHFPQKLALNRVGFTLLLATSVGFCSACRSSSGANQVAMMDPADREQVLGQAATAYWSFQSCRSMEVDADGSVLAADDDGFAIRVKPMQFGDGGLSLKFFDEWGQEHAMNAKRAQAQQTSKVWKGVASKVGGSPDDKQTNIMVAYEVETNPTGHEVHRLYVKSPLPQAYLPEGQSQGFEISRFASDGQSMRLSYFPNAKGAASYQVERVCGNGFGFALESQRRTVAGSELGIETQL